MIEFTPVRATGATGPGTLSVTFDDATGVLQIVASFSGLSGTTTVAHIHCCTPKPDVGTAAGALAALPAVMDAGTAYFNVHWTTFPGSEIRGFVSRVPEPRTLLLLGAGLPGLGLPRWRPGK